MKVRAAFSIAIAFGVASCAPFVPSTPSPIVLKTTAVESAECLAALTEGTLTSHDATGLGIINGAGAAVGVTWPFGYSATPSIGGSNLHDPTGNVVARTGDRVRLRGGANEADGGWVACGPVVRL